MAHDVDESDEKHGLASWTQSVTHVWNSQPRQRNRWRVVKRYQLATFASGRFGLSFLVFWVSSGGDPCC
eukprot:5795664-Amphidinium_carterae.1